MIIIAEIWECGQSWYLDQDMSVHWVDARQTGPFSFETGLRSLHNHDPGAMWEASMVMDAETGRDKNLLLEFWEMGCGAGD